MGKVKETARCPKCAKEGRDTEGDNLAIFEDGGKYCFAGHGAIVKRMRTESYFKSIEEHKDNNCKEQVLGVRNEIDPTGLKYLWSYAIEPLSIAYFGIRYIEEGAYNKNIADQLSKSTTIVLKETLYVPCFKDSFILRRINPKEYESKVISGHTATCFIAPLRGRTKLVFVEDWVSAIKCWQAGLNAIALNGTSLHEKSREAILPILCNIKRLFIWLDPDKAGEEGAKKLFHNDLLKHVSQDAKIVISDKDPKYYSEKEINTFCT